MAICVDIDIVVKVHKIIVLYLPVNSKGNDDEKQANQYVSVLDDKFIAAISYSGHI